MFMRLSQVSGGSRRGAVVERASGRWAQRRGDARVQAALQGVQGFLDPAERLPDQVQQQEQRHAAKEGGQSPWPVLVEDVEGAHAAAALPSSVTGVPVRRAWRRMRRRSVSLSPPHTPSGSPVVRA